MVVVFSRQPQTLFFSENARQKALRRVCLL